MILQVFSSKGNAPAHVHLDTQNHLLHVTNYDHVSGSYAAYALDKNNGAILGNIYADNFESEIGNATEDQKKSHAHHTVTNGKHVYVVDLGLNKILYYEVGILFNKLCLSKNVLFLDALFPWVSKIVIY